MSRPASPPVLLLVLLLAISACGDTPEDILPDPRDGRSGLQLSGSLRDRQIAISDGLPTINSTDCDIGDGADSDLCIITEDISGDLIVVVFENPDVLIEGATIPVEDIPCDARSCDAIERAAIVEVRIGEGARVRARGGELRMEVVVPDTRYRGSLELVLPDGQLSGQFDLVPRPEPLQE